MEFNEAAKSDLYKPHDEEKKGELVNFRDIITGQKDFHLRYPENRSLA